MLKNEFAAMLKRNSSCFCGATLIPFSRLRSSFIVAVPRLHDHFLKNPGGLVRVVRNFLHLRNGIGGSRVGRAEKKKERENECSESFLKHMF